MFILFESAVKLNITSNKLSLQYFLVLLHELFRSLILFQIQNRQQISSLFVVVLQ